MREKPARHIVGERVEGRASVILASKWCDTYVFRDIAKENRQTGDLTRENARLSPRAENGDARLSARHIQLDFTFAQFRQPDLKDSYLSVNWRGVGSA